MVSGEAKFCDKTIAPRVQSRVRASTMQGHMHKLAEVTWQRDVGGTFQRDKMCTR